METLEVLLDGVPIWMQICIISVCSSLAIYLIIKTMIDLRDAKKEYEILTKTRKRN